MARVASKFYSLYDSRTKEKVSNGLSTGTSAEDCAKRYARFVLRDESLHVFFRAVEVDMRGVSADATCGKCGYNDAHHIKGYGCPSCA